MGGGKLRASTSGRAAARTPQPSVKPTLAIPTPLSRHPRAPSPSFLRRQEHTPPIHPSPLTHTTSFPNSSLPPSRGEVRWGVRGHERPPAAERQSAPPSPPSNPPSPSPHPSPVIPRAPLRHSCAGRNPHAPNPTFLASSPNSSLPPFRGEVRWGVGSPERPPAAERQPAPPSPPSNPPSPSPHPPPATPAPPPVIPALPPATPAPPPVIPALPPATPAPPPVIPAPPTVIPAQAGTTRKATLHTPAPRSYDEGAPLV